MGSPYRDVPSTAESADVPSPQHVWLKRGRCVLRALLSAYTFWLLILPFLRAPHLNDVLRPIFGWLLISMSYSRLVVSLIPFPRFDVDSACEGVAIAKAREDARIAKLAQDWEDKVLGKAAPVLSFEGSGLDREDARGPRRDLDQERPRLDLDVGALTRAGDEIHEGARGGDAERREHRA